MGVIIHVFFYFMLFYPTAVLLQADTSQHNHPVALQADTIDEQVKASNRICSESFYGSPHKLPFRSMLKPVPIEESENRNWMLWFLLAGLVLLSIAWFHFPVQFTISVYAVLGLRYFFQIEKDGGFFKGVYNYLLFFNFLIVLSLLVYQSLYQTDMLEFWKVSAQEYVFAAILLLILLFYILKLLFVNFISWVFNTAKAGSIYLGNIFVFNNAVGLILMPFVFHNAFNPSDAVIYGMWFLVIGANIYKLIRGSLIAHSVSGYSVYYLFLYLCAIELLPLVVVWKAVKNYLSVV